MAIEIIGLSTLSNWGPAVCLDDSQGCQTFPRATLCSFATASSSILTIGGLNKVLVGTTVLGGQSGTRYICNS